LVFTDRKLLHPHHDQDQSDTPAVLGIKVPYRQPVRQHN